MWYTSCRAWLDLGPNDDFPFILVGNKSEMSRKAVDASTARAFARAHGDMMFYEVSAKKPETIQAAFEAVAKEVLMRFLKGSFQIPPAVLPAVAKIDPGTDQRLVLTAEGIHRSAAICEEDFLFYGKEFDYHCTTCQAVFISPRVYSLLQQDRTANRFAIECPMGGLEEERIFFFIDRMMNGLGIELGSGEIDGFVQLVTLLDNREILSQLTKEDEAIDLGNAVSRLERKSIKGVRTTSTICGSTNLHQTRGRNSRPRARRRSNGRAPRASPSGSGCSYSGGAGKTASRSTISSSTSPHQAHSHATQN
jgi:hypothetical protein